MNDPDNQTITNSILSVAAASESVAKYESICVPLIATGPFASAASLHANERSESESSQSESSSSPLLQKLPSMNLGECKPNPSLHGVQESVLYWADTFGLVTKVGSL